MSRLRSVKVFVQQRLTVAMEEILGHLEVTIREYEEDLRHRRLRVVFTDQMHGAEVQHQLVIKEEQRNWSPRLEQEDPGHPHIKQEQEGWTSQVRNQLPGLPEDFPSISVFVKSEDDKDKSRFSPIQQRRREEDREAEPLAGSSAGQMKTEADGEDREGSEPCRLLGFDSKCLSSCNNRTSQCSGARTGDGGDQENLRKPQTDLKNQKNKVLASDVESYTGKKSFSCSKCGKTFAQKHTLQTHMRCHTGEKPFSCSLCGKRFTQKGNMAKHLAVHTPDKLCSCPVCGERLAHQGNLTQHMTVHARENFIGERLTKGL